MRVRPPRGEREACGEEGAGGGGLARRPPSPVVHRPRPCVASEPHRPRPHVASGPAHAVLAFPLVADRRERVTSRRPPAGSACAAESAAGRAGEWWGARRGERAVGASHAGPVPGTRGLGGYTLARPGAGLDRAAGRIRAPTCPAAGPQGLIEPFRGAWCRGAALGPGPRLRAGPPGISERRRRPAVGWVGPGAASGPLGAWSPLREIPGTCLSHWCLQVPILLGDDRVSVDK